LVCTTCTLVALALSQKSRVGISFDSEVVKQLDGYVEGTPELASDRSEVVNAIVSSFVESAPSPDQIKDLVRSKRNGKNGKAKSAGMAHNAPTAAERPPEGVPQE
jgi:metal-responsive CopG/Arc/MetJ family transcriptional regulator